MHGKLFAIYTTSRYEGVIKNNFVNNMRGSRGGAGGPDLFDVSGFLAIHTI